MFLFSVDGVKVDLIEKEILTSGAQNIYLCRFQFGPEWEELDKTAVFQSMRAKISVPLGEDGCCRIPFEVVAVPWEAVFAGVYGTKNGELIMPTVMVELGHVEKGASLGEDAAQPTPDVYSQILASANQAVQTAQALREDADAGRFDGADGNSPQIGENGNWFLGGEDTGVSARADSVPAYVAEEAKRVVSAAISKQSNRCVTFLAMADLHQQNGDSQITAGNKHAGQAAKIIADSIHLDFAAILGDYAWSTSNSSAETGTANAEVIEEIRTANGFLAEAFKGIPNFRTPGNHDSGRDASGYDNGYLTAKELFPLIGACNAGAVYGNRTRGYCYRDFEEVKLRVILLNTADSEDSDPVNSERISGAQMQWFAEFMDLSAKTDAADWTILTLAHHPLDWGNLQPAMQVVKAYVNGGAVAFTHNGTAVSYDYSGKNAAAYAVHIHGHTHCLKADNLYLTEDAAAVPLDNTLRMCVPNACFARNNEYGGDDTAGAYGIAFGEAETWEKTADSKDDTAFTLFVLDLEGGVIHALAYGAGYDRQIAYKNAEPVAVNALETAQEYDSSAVYNGVGYQDGVYLSSGGAPYEGTDPDFFLTGYIPYAVPETGLPASIVIQGAAWTEDNHCRMNFFKADKTIMPDGGYLRGDGTDTNALDTYFTLENLGEDSIKLTPIASGDTSVLYTIHVVDAAYMRMSLKGSGEGVVITMA